MKTQFEDITKKLKVLAKCFWALKLQLIQQNLEIIRLKNKLKRLEKNQNETKE